jgi:hypothetical protein
MMASSREKLYFDSCCFIDCARSELKLDDQQAREPHIFFCRKLLEASRAGAHVEVITSTFAVVECVFVRDSSAGKHAIEDDRVKALFKAMLLSGKSGVIPVMPSPAITELARDLRWVNGISCRAADRVHLATAIAMRCSHFVTTDGKLGAENVEKLQKQGLLVATADSLAHLLPDHYKQGKLALPATAAQGKSL